MATARFRYRLYPNNEQRKALAQTFGCARYAYNWALALRKEEPMSYHESSSRLTAHKKEVPWLNDVSCVPVQQALRHLQTSFKNCKERRSGFPSFKRKHDRQSAEFTRSGFKLRDDKLFLAKIGEVKVRWSRELPSDPTTVTIERDPAGRYFASFVVQHNPEALPSRDKAVGIDLGLNEVIVTSGGLKVGNPKWFRAEEKRLRRAQRKLSRAEKGSKNRAKARLRVAKIHARIADKRKDWLDKLSTEIVRRNDTIVVEDLRVRNMVKNRRLAKSISDASWSMFVRMLEYKSRWYGRAFVKVNPAYTSQTCSSCGYVSADNRKTQDRFACLRCGHVDNADVNAALNVLAVGQTVIASEVGGKTDGASVPLAA